MSSFPPAEFPQTRLRRNRRTDALRRLTGETTLDPGSLIYPVFVLEGEGRREAVPSMPGVERKSLDGILEDAATASRAWRAGDRPVSGDRRR